MVGVSIGLYKLCFFLTRLFLSEQLVQDVGEMLLVVQKEVEDDGTWLITDECSN